VIAYATFRDIVPPPANRRFGRTPTNPGMEAACVNPAALGGGKVVGSRRRPTPDASEGG
jgi:hypothetical protein